MQDKHFQVACKLVYNSSTIPILLFNKDQEIVWTSMSKHSSILEQKQMPQSLVNELFSIKDDRPIQLAYVNSQKDKIVLIPYPHNPNKLLVFWPNVEIYFSTNYRREQEENTPLESDTNTLLNTAILLYYILYGEQLSINDVIKENQDLNTALTPDIIELKIVEQRKNNVYHNSYLLEKQLFSAIKLGNKQKMIQYMQIHSDGGVYGTLSRNDSLRSRKNLIITAITLATRAAIDGGLYPEVAYNLSDSYIQHIEELNHIDSTNKLMEEIFIDFIERVVRSNRSNYSKPINVCQEYIFNHLYEDLAVETIASHLNLSPSYLSSKFKEETGITLKKFIQQQRIEEAKRLIVFSDLSLSDISSLLNFFDQSYFVKVFKKYTGQTPKNFRNKVIISNPSNSE